MNSKSNREKIDKQTRGAAFIIVMIIALILVFAVILS